MINTKKEKKNTALTKLKWFKRNHKMLKTQNFDLTKQ